MTISNWYMYMRRYPYLLTSSFGRRFETIWNGSSMRRKMIIMYMRQRDTAVHRRSIRRWLFDSPTMERFFIVYHGGNDRGERCILNVVNIGTNRRFYPFLPSPSTPKENTRNVLWNWDSLRHFYCGYITRS